MANGGSSIPHLVLEDNSQMHLSVGVWSAKSNVLLISALDLDPASSPLGSSGN